jgi:hypothetical protein
MYGRAGTELLRARMLPLHAGCDHIDLARPTEFEEDPIDYSGDSRPEPGRLLCVVLAVCFQPAVAWPKGYLGRFNVCER